MINALKNNLGRYGRACLSREALGQRRMEQMSLKTGQ